MTEPPFDYAAWKAMAERQDPAALAIYSRRPWRLTATSIVCLIVLILYALCWLI